MGIFRISRISRISAAVLLVVSSTVSPVRADLPLPVEDLITDKGKVKLDLSLAYANVERRGVSTGEPIVVQTGPTSFVTLPTAIGERLTNSDSLVATAGVRYGLTDKAEIYVRGSYLHNHQRSSDTTGNSNDRSSRFTDTWAGANYQFKEDGGTPALLGFAEIALREKHSESSASFKSALVGLTTCTAIDPVVFSLTTAYRLNQTRKDGDSAYRPGNLLLINPSVGFAVNDRVTLTTGVQWTSRAADRLDGQSQGTRRTSTDLLLGVGYGFARGNTLNLAFKTNASGRDGADLRVSWLRTL